MTGTAKNRQRFSGGRNSILRAGLKRNTREKFTVGDAQREYRATPARTVRFPLQRIAPKKRRNGSRASDDSKRTEK